MVVTDIDVSKTMLDVSIAEGPVYRFENSDPGIRRWLQHMACVGITQALWVAQATAVLRVAGASPRSDDRAMRRQHSGLAPTGILVVSRQAWLSRAVCGTVDRPLHPCHAVGPFRDVFLAHGLGLVQALAVQDARDLRGLDHGQGHGI